MVKYTQNRPLRIYKAFQAYGTYLEQFYLKNPLLKARSFIEQLDALKCDFFPWILSWSKFNADNNVEIFETINDAYHLQKSWLNDEQYADINWRIYIVIEQIRVLQPDVCVIYPPELFTKDVIDEIRSVVNHEVMIGGYDGMNRLDISKYDGYDFVLTCSEYISEYYRRNAKNTYALEFGFDPSVNLALINSGKKYSFSFNGSIFPNVHSNRLDLLSYLTNNVPIVISSDFENNIEYSLFSKRALKAAIQGDKKYFQSYLLKKHNIGAKYGIDMYQFLHDSKITLNAHGAHIHFAANVRLFEATGVGTCLLTDWKENLVNIFEPDKEVVTYLTREEARDKVKFLLRHDSLREKIAIAGQQRTLEQYTYDKRISGVIDYIKGLL